MSLQNENYRKEGHHLYEKTTDEFGRSSYVHVYHDIKAKTLAQLIASYKEYQLLN